MAIEQKLGQPLSDEFWDEITRPVQLVKIPVLTVARLNQMTMDNNLNLLNHEEPY